MTTKEKDYYEDMREREASYIQILGYNPTQELSNQDWEDELQRNGVHTNDT